MVRAQSKTADSFDAYSMLVRGNGYTEESVDALVRDVSARLWSMQSEIQFMQSQLSEHSIALNKSEHNNDIMKHRMDSAIPQYFTSMKKLESLAFKDRPAMLIETGERFVYDRESGEWVRQ